MNNQQWAAFENWSEKQGVAQASVSGSPLSIENPIILPGGGVSIIESAKHIFGRIASSGKMFRRGDAVVEVTVDQNGSPQLSIVTPAAFRSRIESFGTVLAWRSGANGERVLKPTTCSEDTAKALLNSEEVRYLPPVSLITQCPIAIAENRELKMLTRGYHPHLGGIFVTGTEMVPTVDFNEAVSRLSGLLSDFQFLTPSDRSRALALMITPALKMGGLIQGSTPIFVAEADESQAGKTYLLKIVAAIYREAPKMIAKRKGGVGSLDESFSQALIAGSPFIVLDNMRDKCDSQYLESFLTCNGMFGARVPHRGEIQIDSQRFIIMLSSNGVEATPDLANRSCVVRIRKREGFVPQRDANGHDLLQHVKFHQAYYLGCIFAVIRTWVLVGKPRFNESRHDFNEWAQVLSWIALQICQSAPLLDGHVIAQQRVSSPGLVFLRSLAIAVKNGRRLGQALSASDIAGLCEQSGIQIPRLGVGNSEHAKRQVGIVLKPIFNNSDSVEIEGFVVRRIERMEKRPEGGDYPSKSYEFNSAM